MQLVEPWSITNLVDASNVGRMEYINSPYISDLEVWRKDIPGWKDEDNKEFTAILEKRKEEEKHLHGL
jgi:hypothetical protein